MSLRVWLPLTKDLRNQGLDNVTVTNSGATFNSAGKLGGCYYFNRSTPNYLKITNPLTTATNGVSMAFWVKLPSNGSVNDQLVHIGNGSGWTNNRFTCFVRGGASTLIFSCGDGTNNTNYNCTSSALSLNQWTHVVCLYENSKMKIYLDGVLDKEYSTTIVPSFTNVAYIGIGAGPNVTEPATAYLNDVRIYDHALSEMEVKELSKGLILHYPLNRMGFGQDNLATCTTSQYTISASSTSNYNYFWINSSTLEPNTTYTFSAEVEVSDNITQCTIYNYTSSGNSGSLIHTFPADGKRHSWTFTTTTTGLGLIGYAGNSGATAGHSAVYRNIKIEKGSVATPYIPRSNETLYTTMGLNGTTEYDCSGFCNNGTKNNSPTYSSDTTKYEVSTHVDGVNQTVQLPNLLTLIPDSIFTFNVWFKRLSTEPSSKPWETLLGGPSGFEIETCSANNVHDNKIKAYSWGGGTFDFELDKWNMLTMVSNGTNALFYLNSELKLTGTYKALVSGNYFLGSWRDTSTQNYKGYLSDARIYATALSTDDVLSLYKNSNPT